MKRIILIMIVLIAGLSVHAQGFEVEFTVNKERTVAIYKVKNNTEFVLALMKGPSASPDSMKSYCEVYYKSGNGKIFSSILEVIPYPKVLIPIASRQSYLYKVDLTPFKDKHIVKLEGCFHLIVRKTVKDFETKRIIKSIDLP